MHTSIKHIFSQRSSGTTIFSYVIEAKYNENIKNIAILILITLTSRLKFSIGVLKLKGNSSLY